MLVWQKVVSEETILTWYNDILVVSHQIFENREWRRFDVDISPVNPAMCGAQSCTQQPVTCLGHALSSASLGSETVSTLDVLVDLLSKVLLDDRDLTEGHTVLFASLQLGQKIGEKGESVILGVTNQEGQVDEVVGVGQVAQMRKEHGQVRRSISKRSAEEDSLFALPASRGALNIGKIVVSDSLKLELLASGEQAEGQSG